MNRRKTCCAFWGVKANALPRVARSTVRPANGRKATNATQHSYIRLIGVADQRGSSPQTIAQSEAERFSPLQPDDRARAFSDCNLEAALAFKLTHEPDYVEHMRADSWWNDHTPAISTMR